MHVNPYLMFDGRTEEALDFYKQALGAEIVMLPRFSENPEPSRNPPDSAEKIMHCAFKVGDTLVMASDGDCAGKGQFSGISLSLTVATPKEATKAFDGLADGGTVQMALTKTFFSPSFGMVADKFGVTWMVMAEPRD